MPDQSPEIQIDQSAEGSENITQIGYAERVAMFVQQTFGMSRRLAVATVLFGIAVIFLLFIIALPIITPTVANIFSNIVPTPLEGPVAIDGEALVVIAQFERTGIDYTPEISMREVLEQAANEVGGVIIVPISHPISSREEAQRIADLYNATMVIYGRIEPGGVRASYEITSRRADVYEVEGDFRVSTADIENLEVFVFEGMDATYILGITVGQLYYLDGSNEDALRAFNMAENALLTSRATDLEADVLFFHQGNTYRNLGDYHQAIAYYNRSIEFNPDNKNSYNNRGVVYYFQGEYDQAIADYSQAIELDSGFAIAYSNRGAASIKVGEYEQALLDSERAIELDPDQPISLYNKGLAFQYLAEYEQAIDNYNNAIELDPNYVDAYNNRALAYRAIGNHQQAITDLNHAIEINPDDPKAYINLGNIHYELGQYEEALECFQRSFTPALTGGYIPVLWYASQRFNELAIMLGTPIPSP